MAQLIKPHKHLFLLSKGLGEVVAKEGALKIKELTYVHCQCLSINNMENQFFNYVKAHKDVPSIFVVLDQEDEGKNKDYIISCMEKIKGKTNIMPIVITDVKD